jgi:hypothetical protein
LRRRGRARTLVNLLLTLPRLRLRALSLIVLPHYGVLRLIAVLLALQRLLLLHLRISIP